LAWYPCAGIIQIRFNGSYLRLLLGTTPWLVCAYAQSMGSSRLADIIDNILNKIHGITEMMHSISVCSRLQSRAGIEVVVGN